ncbi:hypothetical protein OH146_05570 [Salinibacterium sp. SYSU T00001]|uniref:hypothetical protein n=1 Tax=Homoserinimonas sedimenticola TaxID=2986805 RepID=UPI0022366598|nr:hypothetical protein [Salinibacterium sedimenticola]MCW4385240.1 hypothetical protein [Salinibacterium sedimenticola]
MLKAPWRGLPRIARVILMLSFVMPAGLELAPAGVPEQVVTYFERDLVPQLTELYAPGGDGESGIRFDDSAEVGPIVRLHSWTSDFVTDATAEPPVELSNQWVAPVLVGGASVGTALVWINPGDGRPELAEFFPGAGLAAALDALPADAQLVRHAETESWFLVSGGVAHPVLPGTTGLTEPVPLASVPPALVPAAGATGGPAAATLIPAAVLVLALLVIGGVVLRPRRQANATASARP